MRTEKLVRLLDGIEAQEREVPILGAGSIERAMELYQSSNPRWARRSFIQLPKAQQIAVLELAQLVEV